MVRNNLTEFPTNPKIGMDCMVKGMVYSYTQLDGYEFWMPSGVRRNYYIHNQDKFESDTWEIIHNLNSYDLTISIFDEDNVLPCYFQLKKTQTTPSIKKINEEVGKVDKPLAIIWNIQEKKDGNVNITSCGEYAIIPKDFFYDLLKNQYEKDTQ